MKQHHARTHLDNYLSMLCFLLRNFSNNFAQILATASQKQALASYALSQ